MTKFLAYGFLCVLLFQAACVFYKTADFSEFNVDVIHLHKLHVVYILDFPVLGNGKFSG